MYQTGTATNYIDLLAKILDLSTTNGWTLIECNGNTSSPTSADLNLTPADATVENRSFLQSTGHGGTSQWQIELFSYQNSSSGLYNLVFRCGVYNVAGDTTYLPNLLGNWQCLTNSNDSCNYWMNVNAGRILCNTSLSSSYYLMYCGYFFPYGSPSQYIAPLCSLGQGANYTAVKYNDDIKSLSRTNTSSYSFTCITHEQSNANGHGNSSSAGILPFRNKSDLAFYSGNHHPKRIHGTLDEYELFESTVVHSGSEAGYLDGIRQVSSEENRNEAEVTESSGNVWICFGQHQSLSASEMFAIDTESV
ncbi:hypothetical protein LO80_03155 [Candidatus Francisella endociliophora]|uniref:Uncharacterized protein n=1 Tax=Candidatus Francisella endociliophora TaxID=653937 RepID=A0A097ENC9_9GAMM|nr:hypothetical protein [Francisella sp. FSC1006]AIT09070.1 hypothetical protein LO80_03155 [Francisella sp. FSC1006]